MREGVKKEERNKKEKKVGRRGKKRLRKKCIKEIFTLINDKCGPPSLPRSPGFQKWYLD